MTMTMTMPKIGIFIFILILREHCSRCLRSVFFTIWRMTRSARPSFGIRVWHSGLALGSVRATLGKSEQSPTPGSFPFLFEAGLVLLEEFALCGIVQKHKLALLIESGHYHVVERQG